MRQSRDIDISALRHLVDNAGPSLAKNFRDKHPIANDEYVRFQLQHMHFLDRYGILVFDSHFTTRILNLDGDTTPSAFNEIVYKASSGRLSSASLPLFSANHTSACSYAWIGFIINSNAHWTILILPLRDQPGDTFVFVHFDSVGSADREMLGEFIARLVYFGMIGENGSCSAAIEDVAAFNAVQQDERTCASWLMYPLRLLERLSVEHKYTIQALCGTSSFDLTFAEREYRAARQHYSTLAICLQYYFSIFDKIPDTRKLSFWIEEVWPRLPRVSGEKNYNNSSNSSQPHHSLLVGGGSASVAAQLSARHPQQQQQLVDDAIAITPASCLQLLSPTLERWCDEATLGLYIRTTTLVESSNRLVADFDLATLVSRKRQAMERSDASSFYVLWVNVHAVADELVQNVVLVLQSVTLLAERKYVHGPLFVFTDAYLEPMNAAMMYACGRTPHATLANVCAAAHRLEAPDVLIVKTSACTPNWGRIAVTLELLRLICQDPSNAPLTSHAVSTLFRSDLSDGKCTAHENRHAVSLIQATIAYLMSSSGQWPNLNSKDNDDERKCTEPFFVRTPPPSSGSAGDVFLSFDRPVSHHSFGTSVYIINGSGSMTALSSNALAGILYRLTLPAYGTYYVAQSGPAVVYRRLEAMIVPLRMYRHLPHRPNSIFAVVHTASAECINHWGQLLDEHQNDQESWRRLCGDKRLANWAYRDLVALVILLLIEHRVHVQHKWIK